MDLRLVPHAEPTDAERAALDAAIGPPTSAWDGGPRATGSDARFCGVQVLAGAISFGSQVLQIEPGSVTSAFGTSCL